MPSLDDLGALDRSKLHVFVAGPGFGEGVAVALPGSGWILLDGCRVDAGAAGRDLPLVETIDRFANAEDPVHWMVLTHPHEDHAIGFAEALDRLDPDRIGLTGTGPPERALLEEAEAWVAASATTDQELARRQLLAAFRRILDRETDVVALHAGKALIDAASNVRVTARAPLLGPMQRLLRSAKGDWEKLRSKANSLSLVFEVEFGATRVVLGGDMVTRPDRGTGWKKLLEARPQLGVATGLKIPHHGSREAQLTALMTPPAPHAAWWVTPFSRGRRGPLPRPTEDMSALTAAHEPIRLTVMPTRESRRRAGQRRSLTCQDYANCLRTSPSGWLDDAEEITPPTPLGAFDPVWATAFDDEGQVVDHWAGAAALEVTR